MTNPPSATRAPQARPKKTALEIRVTAGVVHRRPPADGAPPAGAGRTGKRKAAAPKRRAFTAAGADRHELYQLAVQSPEEDCAFYARVYRGLRGKEARHLREDFCGTALNSSEWVRRHGRNTAEGFDIDPEPLGWGIEHNFARLGAEARRATLHLKDVRAPSARRPDVRTATNFSWWIFRERRDLLEYFRAACADLKRDGIFVLDIYGGPDAMLEIQEKRRIDEGFTYIWDQVHYHPTTGDYKAYIHFRFRDGTELKRAFRYDWRLWSLTEAVDVLRDAGFASVETYWEGTADDGDSGNGIFTKSRKGENCAAWVTYIVASKLR